MVNVDGVVLGNFRTGIIGRDLNRMFRDPELSREVAIVRNLASQLKPFLFLDFHGHCSKKYIFTYGPDYSIDHRYFLQSRLLPKLIEKNTKSFRYYACSFRINPSKSTTARAIMLKRHQVIFTYTIETSIYAYGFKNSETVFTHKELLMAG
jgi:cytosolic carboxypeptidase protein 2/3